MCIRDRIQGRPGPEAVVARVEVAGRPPVGGEAPPGPLGAVEAVRGAVGAVGRQQGVPVDGGVPAARLDVDPRPQRVRAPAQRPGPLTGGVEAGAAPVEVEEHAVRGAEEGRVVVVEFVLPGDVAGDGHGVVPGDPQPAAVVSQVGDEVPHVGPQPGVPAAGLGVEEPAVEAVRPRDLDQLVGERKPAVRPAPHQITRPAQLPAVRRGRQEHRPQHRHTVAVRGVHDGRVRREHQPLTGRAAPEDQLVQIRPVGERVTVGRGRPLGRIERRRREGHERGDPRLPGPGGGVRRRGSEAGGERDGGSVEGEIGIVGDRPGGETAPGDPGGGRPGGETVGVPVGGVRLQVDGRLGAGWYDECGGTGGKYLATRGVHGGSC